MHVYMQRVKRNTLQKRNTLEDSSIPVMIVLNIRITEIDTVL